MGWFKKLTDGILDFLIDDVAPVVVDGDFKPILGILGITTAEEEQAELEAQKTADAAIAAAEAQAAAEKTERDIAYAEAAFAMEQQDAQEKASDIEAQSLAIDTNATEQESLLSRAFKNNMRQLGSSMEEVHAAEQNAKVSQESKNSSIRAAIGASGTRSGSTQEKVIVQNETAFQQALQKSEKSTKETVNFNLASMFQNLDQNKNTINAGRIQANEGYADAAGLRSDYSAGGRAVNLFNQQITNVRADSTAQIDLNTLRTQFKQDAYDRAIERAQWTWEDGFVNIFNLASSGLGMASNIYNLSNFFSSKSNASSFGK